MAFDIHKWRRNNLLTEGAESITVRTVKYSDLGSDNNLPTDVGRNTKRAIEDEDDLEVWREEFIKKYKLTPSDDVRFGVGTDGWTYYPPNRYN
jgi:hypothetical protein